MKLLSALQILAICLLPLSAYCENGLSQLYFDEHRPVKTQQSDTHSEQTQQKSNGSAAPANVSGSSPVLLEDIQNVAKAIQIKEIIKDSPEPPHTIAVKISKKTGAKKPQAKAPLQVHASVEKKTNKKQKNLVVSKKLARASLSSKGSETKSKYPPITPRSDGPRVSKDDASKIISFFFWGKKPDGSCRETQTEAAECRKTLSLSQVLYLYTGSKDLYQSLCPEKCEDSTKINVPMSLTIEDNAAVDFDFLVQGPECYYQLSKPDSSAQWSTLQIEQVKCSCVPATCS